MTSYIIDTHPLIWKENPATKNKLSKKVQKIFDRVNNKEDFLYVPAPVIWELGAYYRARKLIIKNYFLFRHWIEEEILNHSNVIFLETTLQDVLFAGDLKVNQDPFDNLIAATAARMELPLITKDEMMTLSGACQTIW